MRRPKCSPKRASSRIEYSLRKPMMSMLMIAAMMPTLEKADGVARIPIPKKLLRSEKKVSRRLALRRWSEMGES